MARTVVVTGGASGIGRGIAELLLGQGWNVWAFDSDVEASLGEPGRLRFRLCDVRDAEELRVAFEEVASVTGSVDALVCSAGVVRVGELASIAPDDVATMIDVNLKGAWLSIRQALPWLRKEADADDPARVVVIGSIGGIRPKVANGFYSATKAAVHVIAQVFAVELAPSGVTVNVVAPGTTDTAMNAAARSAEATTGFRSSGASPLGRTGRPEDIADAVAFLLSPQARYINGVVLPVDGGTRAAYDNR